MGGGTKGEKREGVGERFREKESESVCVRVEKGESNDGKREGREIERGEGRERDKTRRGAPTL